MFRAYQVLFNVGTIETKYNFLEQLICVYNFNVLEEWNTDYESFSLLFNAFRALITNPTFRH